MLDGMQSFCFATGTRINVPKSFQFSSWCSGQRDVQTLSSLSADNSGTSRGSTTFNSVSEHFSITFTSWKLGLSGSVYGPAKHLSTFLHFGPSVNSPCLKQVRKLCSFCNIACYTLKYLSICIYIDNYICICMLAYSSFTHVSHHLVRRPKNYAHWHCILLSRTFSLSDLCFG